MSAEWISVKERLPEADEAVLVWFEGVKVHDVAVIVDMSDDGLTPRGSDWYLPNSERMADCDPDYWMPLPPAPGEKA